MKLSTTKTIVLEEFPNEVRGWLKKLILPLNVFLEQVYKILVNGITLRDNIKGQVDEIKIGAQQSYPIKLSWKSNDKPTAVFLGYIAEDISAFSLLPQHAFQWQFNQGQLELTLIGLDSSKKYRATIISLV